MLPRFEHRAVPIVLAAVTIDVIGFGIVMPVLPSLITELGHMDLESATRVSGWMLAVFAIAQFFAGPIMGNLGDHFGRRPVLIAAMLAFGLDYLLMAVAPTLAWLFLGGPSPVWQARPSDPPEPSSPTLRRRRSAHRPMACWARRLASGS